MDEKNISKMTTKIFNFFLKKAEKISRKNKFVQRRSKLNGSKFVKALVMSYIANPTASLEEQCGLLREAGVKITKQALHQRMNQRCVDYLSTLFEEAISFFKTEQPILFELLKPFRHVNLLDSTGISLPESMREHFKGYGGAASEAGLKLQVLWNYTHSAIKELHITSARKNDQGYRGHLSHIEKGGLYLQDRGYFRLETFEHMMKKEAFFISFFLDKTHLFSLEDEVSINVGNYLSRQTGEQCSLDVLLGEKKKLPVRLIAQRQPKEVVRKRRRHAKADAKKKGTRVQPSKLKLLEWNIYITNVSQDLLTSSHVILVYALRWQIELFFKLCKSEAKINKIRGKKAPRILCELYAKLIGIVLLLYLSASVRWQEKQELSYTKAFNVFRYFALSFFCALTSIYRLKKLIKTLVDRWKNAAMKESNRRKRKATYQLLMAAVGQDSL